MKFRRHFSASPGGHAWLARFRGARGLWRPAAAFLGAAVIGYLVSALVLFRTPVFVANATVPRVLDLPADSARTVLERADLGAREVERRRHPAAGAGQVIWQDPPPDVVVTAGTTVELSLSDGPQRVPVPDVANYDAALATALIEAAGLTPAIESAQTAAPRGVTVNTRPPAGTALSPGSRVTLVVSQGAPTISVPNLAGLTLDSARVFLQEASLTLGTYIARTSPERASGTVIDQRPAAGTLAAPGTAVDVVLARQSQL